MYLSRTKGNRFLKPCAPLKAAQIFENEKKHQAFR